MYQRDTVSRCDTAYQRGTLYRSGTLYHPGTPYHPETPYHPGTPYHRDTVSRTMAVKKKTARKKRDSELTLDDYDGLKVSVFERLAEAAARADTSARAETFARRGRGKLTPQLMVEVAIKLADDSGLEAVTVRSVGRVLRIPPMRVIRIVGKKDELFVQMIDAIYKELPLPKRGDWRAALRGISKELRAVARRHPWFVGPLSGRPHIGPHSFAYLDAALAALPFEKIDQSLDAFRAVAAYTIGGILSEKSELAYGTGHTEWQASSWVYVQNMIRSGGYPTLKRVVEEAKHREGAFERGLEMLLDGLEASLRKK